MLEEVLGLRQYQIKKEEAKRKLDSTKENLEKVRGLIEELLPHLRMLRRQSKKWEKYDELQENLQKLEKEYFGYKLYDLALKENQIQPRVLEIEKEIAKEQAELGLRQKDLQNIEDSQPKNDAGFVDFKKRQTEILEKRSQVQKDLGRLEAELEFLLNRPRVTAKEEDLFSLIAEIKRILAAVLALEDLGTIKTKLLQMQTKIQQTIEGESQENKPRQEEITLQKEKLNNELANLQNDLAQLGGLEDKMAQGLREFNAQFRSAFARVEEKKEVIAKIESTKRQIVFEQERIGIQKDALAHQARQLERNLQDFQAMQPPPGINLDSLERDLIKIRGELAGIGQIDTEVLKEAEQMEKRYEFLSRQVEDLEKASQDLKVLISELKTKLHAEFQVALTKVNEHFNEYFHLMFSGGKARLDVIKAQPVDLEMVSLEGEDVAPIKNPEEGGLEISLSIPRKNIRGLDMLSGGERSLVSIAVLFALISVSPPPFLVLDEVDAALDENNTQRFANLIKDFAKESQFIIVTHNRATMTAGNVLYGVTMGNDGTSKVLSINLDEVENVAPGVH